MSISDLLSKYSKSKIVTRAKESLPAVDPIATTKDPCSFSSSWIKRLDSARYDSDIYGDSCGDAGEGEEDEDVDLLKMLVVL